MLLIETVRSQPQLFGHIIQILFGYDGQRKVEQEIYELPMFASPHLISNCVEYLLGMKEALRLVPHKCKRNRKVLLLRIEIFVLAG